MWEDNAGMLAPRERGDKKAFHGVKIEGLRN